MNRPELTQLRSIGYDFDHPWQVVDLFEKKVAEFFGSSYAVATDCCTHAMELSILLLDRPEVQIQVPVHTYMSVPMMLTKIRQPWKFVNFPWTNSTYTLTPLPVVDAAFLWQKNSYQPGTLTCVSFQYKKHIAIGRGGMILTDNYEYYQRLQRMCRDGRDRSLLQTDDNITEMGYHYYMTPEDAARGIMLFDQQHDSVCAIKDWSNYQSLTQYSVFAQCNVD